jgi:hypothetical protein
VDYSRVEVAVDSVAKSVANVAISCWSRRMMRSPRFARDDNFFKKRSSDLLARRGKYADI